MKLKLSTLLASAALVFTASANAGFATINGTIDVCSATCLAFSNVGKTLTADIFIPNADGTYQGTDLSAISPNLEIEGNFVTLGFDNESYTDAGLTNFGMTLTSPTADLILPTYPTADTEVTVTSGSNTGILAIAGAGSTTGLPLWGIFDLDAGTFSSYFFSSDSDGQGTPGYVFLADGTFTVSQVPVPAAAWLMGSALLGLAGLRRRKK